MFILWEIHQKYCQYKEELEGARELFQEAENDVELKEMARSEIKEIEPKMEELEAQIQILLLPKDPNDDRNVMLEIRAGTGGSEANIFAGTKFLLTNKNILQNLSTAAAAIFLFISVPYCFGWVAVFSIYIR